MTELIIGNSICHLKHLSTEHFRNLKKILCYRDTSKRIIKAIRNKITGKVVINPTTGKVKTVMIHPTQYLIDKNGMFPTGLLYLVDQYFHTNKIKYIRKDARRKPELHTVDLASRFTLPPDIKAPYPEQIEAAKSIAVHKRGVIAAPTGLGKSLICALILKELGVPTLIVVPSLELKKQLTADLAIMFGDDIVGPLLRNKKQFEVTVENIDQLDPKKPIEGFDCVIIDEFHHSGAKTYRMLNQKAWGSIYYRVGMTATPFRSREDERLLLESVLSKTVYTITYELAVSKGYIVPLEFYYVDLPKSKVKGRTWSSVYKELVVNNDLRNEIIKEFMINMHEDGISALVLVKEVNHGAILKNKFGYAEFVHAKNPDSPDIIKAFSKGDITPLIGSPIIGEGVNTRACEYVFMADMTKSKNLFMQRAGRAIRLFKNKTSGKVILFRDSSHKWLLNHFNECVKFIEEEYACIPVKLDL